MRREEGQTMAEYAVILGVITPAIVGVLALLSSSVAARFEAVADFLT